MTKKEFQKMCDQIEASIREQRPELSDGEVTDLGLKTLRMLEMPLNLEK